MLDGKDNKTQALNTTTTSNYHYCRFYTSKSNFTISETTKLFWLAMIIINMLIFLLSELISSVRYIPYSMNLDGLPKCLKNTHPVSQDTIFLLFFSFIDSPESCIIIASLVSDFYDTKLPILKYSKRGVVKTLQFNYLVLVFPFFYKIAN